MKKVIIALASLLVAAAAYAQGTVDFNNRITGVVDARVLLPDGTGAGTGFTAELLGGPKGTAVGQLTPLSPTTTFRTSSAAAMGYVNGVTVTVPNVAAGAAATLVMRAFNGKDFASSTVKGQSAPFDITLGGTPPGGAPLPPSAMSTLTGFSLSGGGTPVIPEPSTIALGVIGAAALLLRRRK
jgi:hypothetical protein